MRIVVFLLLAVPFCVFGAIAQRAPSCDSAPGDAYFEKSRVIPIEESKRRLKFLVTRQ